MYTTADILGNLRITENGLKFLYFYIFSLLHGGQSGANGFPTENTVWNEQSHQRKKTYDPTYCGRIFPIQWQVLNRQECFLVYKLSEDHCRDSNHGYLLLWNTGSRVHGNLIMLENWSLKQQMPNIWQDT